MAEMKPEVRSDGGDTKRERIQRCKADGIGGCVVDTKREPVVNEIELIHAALRGYRPRIATADAVRALDAIAATIARLEQERDAARKVRDEVAESIHTLTQRAEAAEAERDKLKWQVKVFQDAFTASETLRNAAEGDAAKLSEALREALEIYAGMEGFIPQTAPEGYCLEIIRKMAHAIAAGIPEYATPLGGSHGQ